MVDQQNTGTPSGAPGGPALNPAAPPPEFNRGAQAPAQPEINPRSRGHSPAMDARRQQQPSPGAQPAADAQQQQPPQQQSQPAGEKVYRDWTAAEIDTMAAERAEAQIRKSGLPANEAAYQVRNSPDFKLPEGVRFEFDANSPELANARRYAVKHGLSQEAFSGLLDQYASMKVSEQTGPAIARQRNLDALGAAGPQRIDAVATWLTARAGDDGKAVANFIRQYPSAPIVKAMESLIKQFSSQGGVTFDQRGRETADAEPGKIPGYDKMSFAQVRARQMAERMRTDPSYARGQPSGRRE